MKNIIVAIILFFAITVAVKAQPALDTICILQLNDVYEIGPLEQGKVGGMARVATVVKQHEARYQTIVVLAGDFVSPSVIGTTKLDGQRVLGRHMVDLMNRVGVDVVTFGNHEFDIPEQDLQKRINESEFTWLSSDVLHRTASGAIAPFYKIRPDSVALPTSFLITSKNNQFSVGLVSATIQSNQQPWVVYTDYLQSLKKAWKKIRKQSSVVLGLTHLTLEEDITVLRKIKHIRLLMGGHEHQHNYVTVRKGAIAKADANAKSMYRHLVYREGRQGKIAIRSTLLTVDSTVAPDPAIALVVKAWEDKAYASFRAAGMEPTAVVYKTDVPLDGTEVANRYRQTNLGNLIAASMLAAAPTAAGAVFNSGSIRIDDMITGVITQLDIIRTLPFGGALCEVTLTGELLKRMLLTSEQLRGVGGYLQLSTNFSKVTGTWLLNGNVINPLGNYKIVAPEFLFSGAEKGMEFLKQGNTGVITLARFGAPGDVRGDIRLAVVKYLAQLPAR